MPLQINHADINLVLANSAVASVLILLHAYQLHQREQNPNTTDECYSFPGDLLVIGIIANYAAVAADTFSSELGILSKTSPRLITSFSLRRVPRGTNGGVTAWGLAAGLLGSLIIVTTSVILLPFCGPTSSNGWSFIEKLRFVFAMTIWGGLGSLLDSFLGGWFQQSVVDTRTGRIVEGEGGKTVLVSKAGTGNMRYKTQAATKSHLINGEGKNSVPSQAADETSVGADPDNNVVGSDRSDATEKYQQSSPVDQNASRVIESGSIGILDNNEVNLLMAVTMSVGAMTIAAWVWNIPMDSILTV